MMMRIVSFPKAEKDLGPRKPTMWLTWWMPTGTVVENDGYLWEKVLVSAADQEWREWNRVGKAPAPNANWTKPRGGRS